MNTTIRQRKNGKYQAIISYKVNGAWKQKSKGGFDRVSDAKKWAKDKSFDLVEIERQGIVDSDMTVGELFDLYIEDLELQGKPRNTIRAYTDTKKFYERICSTQLKKLKAHDVKRHIFYKQKETNFSYQDFFKRLKSVLNFACRELKIIPSNPICDLKIKFESTDKRIKFITKEIYQKILDSIDDDLEKLYVQVLYETGMRRSEALGITVFDVKDCKISVNKQYDETLKKFASLKTANSKRFIPIKKELEKKLLSQIPNIEGRLFYGFDSNTIYNKYIRPFNTSIHCFRHTFATNLVSSGIDLTIAAQIIGDDIKTVLSTYTQVNEDKKLSEFDKIRAMF
jgi:integrase